MTTADSNRSAWDVLVGIDLDDWQRADTREQVAWLVELRDHPLPEQGPPPCSCEKVEIRTIGSAAVTYVRGWPNPRCPTHRKGRR